MKTPVLKKVYRRRGYRFFITSSIRHNTRGITGKFNRILTGSSLDLAKYIIKAKKKGRIIHISGVAPLGKSFWREV